MPRSVIEKLSALIKSQQGRMTPSDALFPMGRSTIKKIFHDVSNQAGLPSIRVHDLRHSHASLLIEKGFSPLAIRDRLGHKDIRMTLNTYSHLYPNKQAEIAQILESVITSPEG